MALFYNKLSLLTIMKNTVNQKTNIPSMRVNLKKDFKDGTKIIEFYPPKDPVGITIQLQFAGREVLGKNYYIKRSNMDSYLIWFLKQGNKTYVRDDNRIRLASPNSLVVEDCRRQTEGWTRPVSDKNSPVTIQYYLHFYPSPLTRTIFDFILQYAPEISLEKDEFGFCRMTDEVLDELEKGTFDETVWSIKFYEFFMRVTDYIKDRHCQKINLPSAVTETLDYVRANYNRRITLKDCSSYVNLSPNYLDNVFQQHIKTSVMAYLSKYRFKKAAELLLSDNKSVSEIATEVGLTDSQALIRLFRKNIGMTPLAYKKFYLSEK